MSLFKILWSKHFDLLWQVTSVTAELAPSLNFYQNTHLRGSLFLKRKDGRDTARKNDCSDTSYLRCNTGPFVAVNRGEARSGEIGNIFYDILEKRKTQVLLNSFLQISDRSSSFQNKIQLENRCSKFPLIFHFSMSPRLSCVIVQQTWRGTWYTTAFYCKNFGVKIYFSFDTQGKRLDVSVLGCFSYL